MATENQQTDYDNLIKDIKNSITTRLGDLMSKLLNSAEDSLFEMADSATNNEDQNRYFELMRQLKSSKAEIQVDFIEKVSPYLRPYGVTEAEKEKQSEDLEGELSLVETSVVEDMVLVKNIGERAAGKYREQLSHLEARLEHLALKTDDIFEKHALMPINFCQAFDDTLGETFELENKKILFDLFNDGVASKLDALYDSINNRMIDAGILPQIKLFTRSSAPRRRHSDMPPAEDMPQEDLPPDEPEHYGNYAMTAAPGASYGGGNRGGAPGAAGGPAGGMQGGAPGAAGGPAGGMQGGAPGAAGGPAGGMQGGAPSAAGGPAGGMQGGAPGTAGGPNTGASGGATGGGGAPAGSPYSGERPDGATGPQEYSHYTAGIPAEQVSQALGQFFGAPIAPAGAEPGEGEAENFAYPASTPQYYGHDEIITALSQVQSAPEFGEPTELKFDAEAVKSALLSEIASKSGGAVTKRINHIAEKTIDFIELIFDAIIDDEHISDTIKALLLRLQIPVIKASMLDQEFFIYDDHPARLLLDKISDVGVGVTDHNDEVYIRLDKIVTALVSEFDLQTSTFQHALDQLNEYVAELEEEARLKEEDAQRQVLREHARNTVLKALRSVTAGKVLPEDVHPLVLKRWPTLMFNHYLENGKENEEWIVIIELLRDIIDSVQPILTAEDLAHLQAVQDSMIDDVREHLSRTNQSTRDIENVIQGLIDTHQQMIEDADFSEEQIEKAEAEEAVNPKQPEPVVVQEDNTDKPKPPANVFPGMWFRVHMGDDTIARRCKLSVIIVEDANLVFVNHAGEIVVEKSFDEFNDELKSGTSTEIMGHSVFDHALNSVITRLSPETEAQQAG